MYVPSFCSYFVFGLMSLKSGTANTRYCKWKIGFVRGTQAGRRLHKGPELWSHRVGGCALAGATNKLPGDPRATPCRTGQL